MSKYEDLQRATTGYKAAISLWKLSSQQIYSRFSAMLIANSIVFGATGFAATRDTSLSTALLPILGVCGLLLCVAWIVFVRHGVKEEKKDMKTARELEKDAIPRNYGQGIVHKEGQGHSTFMVGAAITIGVFIFLYSSVLCYSWHLYCSYLFGLFKG